MSIEIHLTSVTFSDGRTVDLGPSSALVIVGPNNAGKSQALRDLRTRLTSIGQPLQTQVIHGVTTHAEGSDDDIRQWLADHAHKNPSSLEEQHYSRPGVGPAGERGLVARWQRRPEFGELGNFFFAFAGGEERLQMTASQGVHDVATQPPTTPLQVLFVDAQREEVLADAAREAFGEPVVVNRVSGQNIHLHVGQLPDGLGSPLVTNPQYLEAINSLPHVASQGDGFKSYIGLVLLLASAEFPAVLVDEPEAFLHPPQARTLGRRLAQAATDSGSQLIMATHSLDVLQGVLSATGANATVVRLRRDGDLNRAAVLEPDGVRSLWNDPIIRFSNALDGIFHRGVVVCEGDADARFYDATLRAAREREDGRDHGLLFTHCGGKQRVPVIVDALRGLDVPVRSVCDIDVLREERPLRTIVEGLGGDWATVQPDWNIVRAAIDNGPGVRPRLRDVQADIETALRDGAETSYLTRDQQRQVRQAIRLQDPWQALKLGGAAAIPAGDATQAWQRLDSALRAVGLFVVPVGTLERWNAAVGDHGPRWVAQVLEQDFHNTTGPHATFTTELDQSID